MILCITVSILSIMPQVQERISRSGLLQSSVVTLYVIYLTWSALSNNPNPKCHTEIMPSDGKNIVGATHSLTCNQVYLIIYVILQITFDKTSIVGLVIWMVCLLYSSLKSASKVSELTVPDIEKQGKFHSAKVAFIVNRIALKYMESALRNS